MSLTTRADLTALLTRIMADQSERDQRIREFQEVVFDSAQPIAGFEEQNWEIIADLAYDLDFYVSEPELRREGASYYGDERLVREIREALAKLGALPA